MREPKFLLVNVDYDPAKFGLVDVALLREVAARVRPTLAGLADGAVVFRPEPPLVRHVLAEELGAARRQFGALDYGNIDCMQLSAKRASLCRRAAAATALRAITSPLVETDEERVEVYRDRVVYRGVDGTADARLTLDLDGSVDI